MTALVNRQILVCFAFEFMCCLVLALLRSRKVLSYAKLLQ